MKLTLLLEIQVQLRWLYIKYRSKKDIGRTQGSYYHVLWIYTTGDKRWKERGEILLSREATLLSCCNSELKGYLVPTMIDKENKLACIFFIHPKPFEEIKRRGEILIIDATYKANNLDMSLILVQSVSNLSDEQLSTGPIAYGIAARETTEVYTWFLQTLKDHAHNQEGTLRRAPVIVTDKSAALMAAIRSIFPDSSAILCTWHMTR